MALSSSGYIRKCSVRRDVDWVDSAGPNGVIYVVLGTNGSGNTTSISMLLGIIEPDDGERELLGCRRPRQASDRVGYLPEERGLYPAMKAAEAIAFMGALRGLDWRTGRKRAREMLADAEIGRAHV